MVKVLCTIWALMLNAAKIYVFQTCCENPFEDDEDTMIIGPPLPAFFFATGVYVILAQISLLPQSFQKPIGVILCVYEVLIDLNDYAAAEWFEKSQHVLMTMILFIVSIGFLLISLHVAKALDFSILTDYGVMAFLECAVQQLWRRLVNEFRRSHGCILDCSTLNDRNRRPKKPRKRRRPFRECNCSTDS
ncbi:hypothetical protein PV325_002707 [Microctonus aethiopoides]|nr:hypothetical protein PV325_002707 [Microctonus aethiopoides]